MNKSQQEALDDINSIIREMRVSPEMHNSVTNTASIKSDGWVVGLAVAALALTLYSAIQTQLELHDLRAWKDIHQNEISTIKAKMEHDK